MPLICTEVFIWLTHQKLH